MEEAMENLIDTKRAAEILGLREPTIRKYTFLRILPCVKIGASVRFRPSELEKFILEHRVPVLGAEAVRKGA